MVLVESYLAFERDYWVIRQYIEKSLQPFRTGDIRVTVTEAIDDIPKVRVDVSAFPNDPCIIQDYRLWKFNRGYEFLVTEIGFRAAKHYRSIPALPVDDHIVLGSN